MAGTVIGEPTECDLFRKRGDTKDFVIIIKDAGGNREDIDGWTALLTITVAKAPLASPPDVVFQAVGTPDPASPQTPTTTGRMIFDFSAFTTQSPQIVPGKFFYDVQVTDNSAKDCTVLEGKYEIGQDRTK